MQKTYRVEGMTCQGCARSVTRAVQSVRPDAEVSVDLEKGLVTVAGEAGEQQVRQAVEDAGFEFAGVAI